MVKWIFFEIFFQKFPKKIHFTTNFGWGALPPDPPLNGRSSHLIEAGKRARLDQMIFFSVPLTTRAPPGRPAGRPAERPAERPAGRPLTTRAPPTTVRRLTTRTSRDSCFHVPYLGNIH